MNKLNLDRRRTLGALGALGVASVTGRRASAAAPVQMISHRYPALELYAEKMRSAVPGVEVNTQLMPFDKANELATIALSSKADTVDLVYASDSTVQKYAKNGWLRPLDDFWEKYKAEYNFADFPESGLAPYRYEGKLYVLPHNVNVMMLFYRKDLLEAEGKQVPKTIEEFVAIASEMNSPMRSGAVSCMKPVDANMNEAHWYMNAIGDGWFDENWKPIFNNEKGVKAIETLKEVTSYAQRGFATAANDECSLAYQQDLGLMGLQWATRAASMDDPAKSRVVDLIDWAAPPGGHGRLSGDGYAISAFSKQDPDLLFRIIATSSNEANMREAAALTVPPRESVLRDPELAKKFRHYPGILASLETAQPFPPLPEFYEVGEFISRRILQAVAGEMEVQAALDAAAGETEQLLRSRGYYQ
ncbi:MAG TPA: extracellular solute-binding protein [Geminicoccus sp.]|jgi:ABC-type glycerol-3-phosphate transport system substrate-binding protein|uniref:extracellular solute-binding protein n=1 Tax=Geminicoccus sp. TaxID=2024832 RepID=UPI002E34D852|nr:extracellular solute-binding protein [Geminicoccus sp.]HEX2526015.1 extracellular solute-binding protein [Geminicoccus sp.]